MPALLVSHKRPGFYCRVIEEGEIGAGDEIVKVADGPEHVTVKEIDGLLYLPGHSLDQLQRALRIPSLSAGWKGSLEALVAAEEKHGQGGNAGLSPSSAPPPAWPGFRSLRVAEVERESIDVLSFVLESEDHTPLPAPLPGQFLVFKLELDKGSAPILRSYSVSDPQRAGMYRVSVKRSIGVGSRYFHDHIRAGDVLQVSAPRGQLHSRSRQQTSRTAQCGASERHRCLRCSIRLRLPAPIQREKSGGVTVHAMAENTLSRQKRASCSIVFRTATHSSPTASRTMLIAKVRTTMPRAI